MRQEGELHKAPEGAWRATVHRRAESDMSEVI